MMPKEEETTKCVVCGQNLDTTTSSICNKCRDKAIHGDLNIKNDAKKKK